MTENLTELELECGVTLELKPGKQMVLLEFLKKGGSFDAMASGEIEGGEVNPAMLSGFTDMVNYVAGWCVTNEVPKDDADELAMFGGGKRSVRSRWVRQICTEEEISQLFAQAMALTFKQE